MKKFAIAIFALLICAVILPSVLADVTDFEVSIKDISEYASPISVEVGETIPIDVTFILDENASDVVIEAELYYGHGKEVTVKSDSIDVLAGTTYIKKLSLKIPSDIDTSSSGEEYTLYVRLKDKQGANIVFSWNPVTVQRQNDLLVIQKIMKTNAEASKSMLVTVVVKNIGSDRQDDVYVKIVVPELGIVKEERVGDIVSEDMDDKDDTATVDVPLLIPEKAADGTYSMTVTAYNDNVKVEKTESIKVKGVENTKMDASEVVPQIYSQEVEQGKSVTYPITIGNLADSIQSYSVEVSGTDGWASYTMTPLKITLSGNDSEVINVALAANKDAMVGQHTFVITVKNDNQVVKQFTLTSNVKEAKAAIDAMLVSAIVLAVVLLVLIVILVKSRKTESADTEESYY